MFTVSLSSQAHAFLCALICGVLLGLVYTMFGLVRTLSWDNRAVTFICDVIYMLVFTVVTYIFSVGFTEGFVRAYILAGELVGFLIYKFTLGNLISVIFRRCAGKLREISLFLQKNISVFAKKLLKQSHKMLYNKDKIKTNLRNKGKEGLI